MELIDGKYVTNGEKNLFVKITGNGKIPVVIEPAWGSLSLEWLTIQNELSKHTTVITYDRAGYGESPIINNDRTSLQISKELYIMLQNSGVQGPYLFVGHDAGGLYLQHFMKVFANEVAGLVLVDSLSIFDDEFDKLDLPNYKELMSYEQKLKNFKEYSELSDEELHKNIGPLVMKMYDKFPDMLKKAFITYLTETNFYQAVFQEMSMRNESINLIKQLSLFTNLPINILCRDYEVMIELSKSFGVPEDEAKIVEELWLKNSKDLENLSTNTEFNIIKGVGHNMHLENPSLIVETILKTLDKCD